MSRHSRKPRSRAREPRAVHPTRLTRLPQMRHKRERMRIRSLALASVTGFVLAAGAATLAPTLRAAADAGRDDRSRRRRREVLDALARSFRPGDRSSTGKYTRQVVRRPTASSGRSPVPGRGHSSPIIWGDHIFLTTEHDDGARLSMLAFSRSDGKQLWETFVPDDGGRARLRKEQPRLGDGGDRRQARLRVLRHARSRRVRLQRQDRVAHAGRAV